MDSPLKVNTKSKKAYFDERTLISRSESSSDVSIYKNEYLQSEGDAGKKQKPKLLKQLELFLKKELYLLGVSSHDVNDVALQAHQEVFEYLIDNFKTYKPLLSCIKNSYEVTLTKLRSQLHDLTFLKQMVVTTGEKYEKKIMDIYDEKKQELILIEEQNIRLQKHVNVLLEDQGNIEYILERLKREVNDINEKFSNETNHHKMLVTEINHLHAQQQFTMKQLQKHNVLENIPSEVEEDPVTLKNAVNDAREKERNASQTLATIAADYCDVIPKKDYESLKKKYEEEGMNYEDLLNTYKLFGSDHGVLLKMNQSLTEERDHYYSQLNKLQSVASAIEHWNKCIGYISGENISWHDVSSEKASRELLQILLQTISPKETALLEMDVISFTGKGFSPNVPKLLRYEGNVKNRRMTQRDCIYMIKDIWSRRAYQKDESCFMVFFEAYMEEQYPDEELRREWSYTFYFVLKQLAPLNNYIKLFWKILNEEVEESIYHCQEIFSAKLLDYCQNHYKDETKQIPRTEFQALLEEFLKGARADFVSSLVEKAVTHLESDQIQVEKLLQESAEGEISLFLVSIREWLKRSWKNYVENISKTIEIKYIYPDDLTACFEKSTITCMKPLSLTKLQCWCFNLQKKELATAQSVTLEVLLTKLSHVGFVYKPPQPTETTK